MKRIFIYAKEDLAKNLAMVLSMRGHTPMYSDRPREALRQIITFRPTLVLAEYLDPDIDGEWLCCEIRKIKQLDATQVIMMSELGPNISKSKVQATALSFGANGYLPKPFPCHEISNYLHSWLHEN